MNEQDAVERIKQVILSAKDNINEGRQESLLPHPEIVLWPSELEYLAEVAITEYNVWLRDRATDDDVVEAVARALWYWSGEEIGSANPALTAALDVMFGKEQNNV